MNTPELITTAYWLGLPVEARQKIAAKLELRRSCGIITYNRDGITTVKCDGYSQDDLNTITKERMSEVLGKGGGFWELFGQLVGEIYADNAEKQENLACACGLVAKSLAGLKSHERNCVYKEPNKADNHQKDEKVYSEGKPAVGSDGDNLQNGDEGTGEAG